jgi:hypothetical protein
MTKETRQLSIELAEQLQKALTAGNEELFQLVLVSQQETLLALLKNPQLNEEHLLALLKRRDLTEELLKGIYQRHAKKLSHQLMLALARNPGTPGTIISRLLPQLRLFELVDLCYLPGVTPDQRLAAEREIILRLPTTPLGNKITLARRATSTVVGEALKEGLSSLVDVCLNSPRLKEAAIYQFLNSARATAETISMIARHNRWRQRPNLRLAILKNHQTPAIWFTLWLPKMTTTELRQLLASRRLKNEQKKLVTEQLRLRGTR